MAGYGRFRKSGKVNRSVGGMYRNSITSGYGSYSKGKKTTYRGYYLGNKGVEKKYRQSMGGDKLVATSDFLGSYRWSIINRQGTRDEVHGKYFVTQQEVIQVKI